MMAVLCAPAMPSAARKAPPADAAVLAAPQARATHSVTSFAEALTCMDGLLAQYGKRDIAIMSSGIPDRTETLKVGTRDMLISAMDAMSLRSGAFRFVDADREDFDSLEAMQATISRQEVRPEYYIKGSISALDQDVMTDTKRIGLSINQASVGASKDRIVSNITMEMGIYSLRDRVQVRGVRTQNTMQIVRGGSGTDLEGLLPFASLLFEVRKDRAQGPHQTVRTLLELSLIELVGKFTKVPYWRCLSLPSADPAARRAALDYFSTMTAAQRVTAVQSALAATDGYAGPVDGLASPQLAQAVARYRTETGLAPHGDVDFELYYMLLTKGLVANGDAAPQRGRKATGPLLAAAPADDSLILKLTPSATSLMAGDTFHLTIAANREAYVYCFMGGATDKFAYRIYPNAFTGSQPRLAVGQVLRIPGGEGQFSIRLDTPGQEDLACVGRTEPFRGAVPFPVSSRALVDKMVSRGSLNGVASAVNDLQAFDRQGLRSDVRTLRISVAAKGAGR